VITCRELVDALDDYVAGRMAGAELETFEKHLAVCPDCVNYIESYRRTVELERAAFADLDTAPPADVPEDLIVAILAARKTNL
jgi:anti-sigma factor RsiW